MSKRLAITISGAVSLGSYEAGVLFEVLQAIAAQNAAAQSEDEKIYIDVLTGASAGAMCAAVLAQKLLYDGAALTNADTNALHDPWIVDVSLAGLLNQQPDEDPAKSIFSSNLIEAISRKYLTARYTGGVPPPALSPHPAIEPGKPLRFGLALSNLDGVDYSQSLLTGGTFTYTRYQDEFRRQIAPDGTDDNQVVWDEIRQAAVASGAFPFAFRVKELLRKTSDYIAGPPSGFPQLNMRFAYTDGGVFQNEPLGLAKNFVDQIDQHLNSDTRFYLFIAPGTRASSIAGPADLLTAATANYANTAKGLAGAIFNQARFHDWIMAEKVNQHVDLFNRRAEQLKQGILNRSLTDTVIGPAADAYLAGLQKSDGRLNAAFIDGETTRLRQQFAGEYAQLQASPGGQPAADAWLRSILVLELAAELRDSDEMNILAITAREDELAGSSLSAFAGFFEQKIRQHDYDVGRNHAKTFITDQNAATATQPRLGPFHYDPGAPVPLDPAYEKFDVSKLPHDERVSLKDRFSDRVNTLLAQAGVPWIIRKPLMTFYLDGKIAEFLKLDS